MINRRTLLKSIAAMGCSSVLTPKWGHSMAVPSVGLSRIIVPSHPALQQSTEFLSNLMAIERWENLIDDLDCVELVMRYATLKQTFLYERTALDLAWRAECPFCLKGDALRAWSDHYSCHNCESHGSAIEFFSKMEEAPLAGAVSSLEAMLESGELKGHRAKREPSWTVMAEAERFYHKLLLECSVGAGAKRWLASQGVDQKTIEMFRLGYAPARPGRLLSTHLLKAGFSFRTLCETSVMCHDHGAMPDRFSGVVIPIHDQQGHCYGFMESHPEFPPRSGEWIQRTACIAPRGYRRLVFPAPSWPEDFHKFKTVLIAESLADVLVLHSAGITNAVYLLGLESYALRSALAVGKTLIYPWRSQHEHRMSVGDVLENVGSRYDNVNVLMISDGHNNLTEMLRAHGPDALRAAMKEALPMSEWLGC